MDFVSNLWNSPNVQDHIFSSFVDNSPYKGNLSIGKPIFFYQTEGLKIPTIQPDDIEVDLLRSRVNFHIEADPSIPGSASSISSLSGISLKINDIRTFIHDYTFAIVSTSTDMPLRNFFPVLGDGFDNLTPDVIINNQDTYLVLEFATSRSNLSGSLKHSFEVKQFKYEEPLRNRLNRKQMIDSSEYYMGLVPIICNSTMICTSSMVNLSNDIVNEICARFRFALSIVDIVIGKGINLEDDDFSQTQQDILNQMKSITTKYNCLDSFLPFTPHNVHLKHSEEEAAEYAKRTYMKGILNSLEEMANYKDVNIDELVEEYKTTTSNGRVDQKSIVLFPYCTPDDTNWVWERGFHTGTYPEFIDSIIEESKLGTWSASRTVEEHKDLAMKDADDPIWTGLEKQRKNYKRLTVGLNMQQKIDFGKVGVCGKSMSNNVEVQMYRESKKEIISSTTNTDDVDEFLSGGFEVSSPIYLPETMLIDHALANHGDTGHGISADFQIILGLDLFQWCTFLSDIGSELCLSLKQNVDSRSWVVKKLQNFDCYLIIKPTNSTSHIFVCLVFSKTSKIHLEGNNVTRQIFDGGQYYYTEFISYNVSRLVNLVKTQAFFVSNLAQWSRYNEMKISQAIKSPEIAHMVKLCLLIHLEDKHQTEEAFSTFRYLSMEKFVVHQPKPEKILERFPPFFRTRLELWAIKKLLIEMKLPVYEKDKKTATWVNIRNPYTNTIITDPGKLIELFYLGYATNKDTIPGANAEFKLIKKILQYEDELTQVERDTMINDGKTEEELLFHEWKPIMIAAAADHLKRYYKNLHGGNYHSILNQKILYRLSRITWDEIATLKASSTFDPADFEPDVSQEVHTHRIKALVAVMKDTINLADTPILAVPEILDELISRGGLNVDLFRKNQHGGLREIYVLDIKSRIVQLCIEEIARALCDDLPIEVMMHPENKIKKPQEHLYKSAINTSPNKLNISSSNDAKVWNQTHHVLKFCQFLCRLLDPMWHPFIINSLQLWTKKRIKYPDGVINHLIRRPSTTLSDPVDEMVRDVYLGRISKRWANANELYCTIESGMMQGILHYLSSLFHASMLMLRDSIWSDFCMKQGISFMTTDLVSSDDSSRITDVFTHDHTMHRLSLAWVIADHKSIKQFSRAFGIYMSNKSTMCTTNIMEFNSEFFIGASLYRPTLKWSYAALSIVEVESMIERQEVSYNQITELLEGGSGFYQACLTQISQALLHYRLLGSSVNPLFLEYRTKLLLLPDASLGYFMLDNPTCTGMPGLTYNLWLTAQNHSELNKALARLLRQGELTTTSLGNLVRGVQVRYGNRMKIRKLLEELETVKPDWRECIENDPEVLYRVAPNIEYAKLKIMVKVTNPSVTTSISKGNDISRMMSSGAYLITQPAMTIGSAWMDALDLTKPKISLWCAIHMDLANEEPLTDGEMNVLFSNHEVYKHFKGIVEEVSSWSLVSFGSRKRLKSHILVFPEPPKALLSLEAMVKWKWFGDKPMASKQLLLEVWNHYKQVYPWLEDDPVKTLENPASHFTSQIQLRNYIARQTSKSRVVHLTGSPIRDTNTRDLLVATLARNQLAGHRLVEGDLRASLFGDKYSPIQSHIAGILSFPLENVFKRHIIKEDLQTANLLWDGGPIVPPSRKLKLALIQQFLKISNTPDSEMTPTIKTEIFFDLIKKSRLGVVGGFTTRQYREDKRYSSVGSWDGLIGEASVSIRLKNQCVTAIITNSLQKLRLMEMPLSNLMREFGVINTDKGPVTEFTFDLHQIRRDGVGCPLYVNPNFGYIQNISFQNIKVTVGANNMRLINIDPSLGEHTIVSYYSQPGDMRFLEYKSTGNFGLDYWLTNKSLPADYALRQLQFIMRDSQTTKFTDRSGMISLAKVALEGSLIREGWTFNLNKSKAIVEEWGEYMEMADDFLSNVDFDYKLLQEVDYNVDLVVEAENSDLLALDVNCLAIENLSNILEGIFDDSSKIPIGDIRRIHKYYDILARDLLRSLSEKEKNMLMRGTLISGEHPLIELLTFFFNYTFEAKLSIQVVSSDPADDL